MFTLILLAAFVQPDVPQPDGPKSSVQSSMAPDQGLAVINDKGTLTLTRLGYVERKEVWLKAPAKKDSEKVHVKTTVTGVQLEVVELPAHVVQAYTVDGKAIEAAKLGEMLAKERTVLIALGGKNVDPFHLELYKEGTIILVTPANLWDRGHGAYGLPGPQYLPDGRSGGYGSYHYYYPSTRSVEHAGDGCGAEGIGELQKPHSALPESDQCNGCGFEGTGPSPKPHQA